MNTIAAVATALPIGAALGAAAVKGLAIWRRPSSQAQQMSDAARSEPWQRTDHAGAPEGTYPYAGIQADFGAHVRSVREQVSHHADVLAGGDQRLRAELRRFERWPS